MISEIKMILKLLILGFLALTGIVVEIQSETSLQTTRQRGFPIPKSKYGSDQRPKYWSTVSEGRLPTSIIPSHYKLSMTPILDPNDPVFGDAFGLAFGDVTITIECKEVTNIITLHVYSALIKIDQASVQVVHLGSSTEIPVTRHEYIPEYDFYTLTLSEELVFEQFYDISIKFNTTIATDRYDGLYLTQYLTPGESEPSLIAVTTFAASAARQAFPCFDEPALKTTFDITIGRTDDFISLSNAEWIETTEDANGWKYDAYNTTVPMSTYLAIIFVANYSYKEADLKLPGDKTVRVYAPPYMIDKNGADYAANISQQVMTFYEEYFGIDYKLKKYDSAAIPDFQFGAMENYGLVTYKTPFLMYFENETTEAERKRISEIVAHESSHQWFGNLITAKWWNHIWLNEGFASYLAPLGVNFTNPEFEPEKGFLTDIFQYSMPFDSDPSYTHPILSSDEITAPFYDRINYEKGACIIRMMDAFLTSNTLKTGLQTFLEKWTFQAVGQDDLFEVLTTQGHADGVLPLDLTVKDIMDTWTQQPGFPLVKVSTGENNSIYISQERFVSLPLNPADVRDLDPNDLWNIPISIATASNPDFTIHTPTIWLKKGVALTSYIHNTSEWIMLNLDGKGYYRVLYDHSLLNHILIQLDSNLNVISPLSRSQLIDDYFKSAMLSHVNIETAFELTKYLGAERDSIVWDTVLTNLEYIYRMLETSYIFIPFRDYLKPKLEAAINASATTDPTEKGSIVLYRLQLIDWACGMDSTLCVNHAKYLFSLWQADPNNNTIIQIDLQPVIYCTAVANDDQLVELFEFVLQTYSQEDTLPHQKSYLLNALACSREIYLLNGLLEEIANNTSTIFPAEDAKILLQRITLNSHGREHVLRFIRDEVNLDALIDKFGVQIIADTLSSMSLYANEEEELTDIENFVNVNIDKFASITSSINNSLKKIQDNITWMDRFSKRINDWLLNAIKI